MTHADLRTLSFILTIACTLIAAVLLAASEAASKGGKIQRSISLGFGVAFFAAGAAGAVISTIILSIPW
jgi:VIT1/CCC1 family predicted Fe2+/Mn2+ transporter